MMPVSQTKPYEGMPPLVRAAVDIELPWPHALRELGDVEEKGQEEEEVEDDDPGEEDLDLVTVKTIHDSPVEGGDETIDDEGHKVDQSDHDVFILVHLVFEDDSAADKGNYSDHVDSTYGGMAPEGIVDSTEERGRDGGQDADQVHHQTELVGVLAVGGECVEDCGHDHADLVTADDDKNDREVLPGDDVTIGRCRGGDEVPEKDGQEEDEAQEVGPDIEGLIVQSHHRSEALPPTLV